MANSRSAYLRGSADSRMIELDYSVISQYADRQVSYSPLEESIYKVSITGEFIEVTSYQFPIKLHIQRSKIARDSSSDRLEEYQKVSNRKSFSTLRSLIFGNFSIFDKFITITFKDTEKFDIRDLTYCNFRKERFVKKLKEIKPDLKYIIVPEYQKRGAVHYHILCNLQYVPKDLFKKYWIYGFSSIDAIKELDKSLFYLTKYISKNIYFREFKGRRRFYASKNIIRPISLYGEPAREIAEQLLQQKPICSYSSETEWLGNISYRGYRVPYGQFELYRIVRKDSTTFKVRKRLVISDPDLEILSLGL